MSGVLLRVEDIDWAKLSAQKGALLRAMGAVDEPALDGLLGLVDAIQDRAVDELEVTQSTVFAQADEEGGSA